MKTTHLGVKILDKSEYCLYSLLENKLRIITQNQEKIAAALVELLEHKRNPRGYK